MTLLKNNKAAGEDDIGAELIKMGPERLAICLHRLIDTIWETKQLPEGRGNMARERRQVRLLELSSDNHSKCGLQGVIPNHLPSYTRMSSVVNEFVGCYRADFINGRSMTSQIFTVR